MKKATKKIITPKEQILDSGIILPDQEQVRKIAGNEALIEMIDNEKDNIEAVVIEKGSAFIVKNKETGETIRTYVKEAGCDDPEACAKSFASKFRK